MLLLIAKYAYSLNQASSEGRGRAWVGEIGFCVACAKPKYLCLHLASLFFLGNLACIYELDPNNDVNGR